MKNTQEINVFDLTKLQDKPATLYNQVGDNLTYIYIGADRYNIPEGTMALLTEKGDSLSEKIVSFKFSQDVRLEGQIAVLQVDASYMVTFVTPAFSGLNGDEAVNDLILLRVGHALKDLENV